MTRYANIIALYPRSSDRVAGDREPQALRSSVAVYKLVCAVDILIDRIVNSLRTRLATLGRWYRYRVKPSVRRWVDDYLAAIKENGA